MKNCMMAVLMLLLGSVSVAAAKSPKLLSPPTVSQVGDEHVMSGQVEQEVLRELRELNGKISRLRKANLTSFERIDQLEKWRKSLPSNLVGREQVERMIQEAISAPNSKIDACLDALKSAIDGRISALEEEIRKLKAIAGDHETRISGLEEGTSNLMFLRLSVFGGLTLGGDGDKFGGITGGISKKIGSGLADIESSIGGTERANGLLVGGRADYLFEVADTFRVGPGLKVDMNYGDSHAEVGPDFTAEVGSVKFSGLLRLNMPYTVADPTGKTGWIHPNVQVGALLRF